MKQQVNFYQQRFRPTKAVLSMRALLQISAAVVAVLALISGYGWWSTWNDSRRLGSLRERLSGESERIAELTRRYPPREIDPELEADVNTLTLERDAKTRVLRLLSSRSLGNTEGFSRHVAGLARKQVRGLWLSEIRIGGGGHRLTLAGSALEPELVPRFIQQLSRETVFAGTDFESVRMQRSETDRRSLDFALSTEAGAEP